MKLAQKKVDFSPITITLESDREAGHFWDMVNMYKPITRDGEEMKQTISDWLSNKAKL